ncbi:triacylglycerol lipase II precursor [Fusarium coicis]|nr:triacylglycerol lipase II precursor [Fusarium coicis]
MGNSISYTTSDCHVNLPNSGSLKGLQFDSKSRRFADVPYAQPPVGNLRWRKPQPLPKTHRYESLDGSPFDTTHFGPVCPQANYSKNVSEHIPKHAYSEDCLRLNIWTPVPDPKEPNKKWPVMVWFHGGWFQVGDPSQDESMDPTELISTGGLQAVFVAVGYRLNVFGFLAGKVLLEESGGEAVGNYGLWDQRLAMDWVYENICAFGGDPQNIILAGRSAGAYSVLAQTLHDFRGQESHGHFTRMIMYSNAIPTQPKTVQDCEEQFDELCEYFGIPADISGAERLRNLRSISADDLSSAIMELKNHTFRPVTDDLFIHSGIFDYYRDGSFAREFKKRGLKLYIGEVLDEDTLYAVTNPPDPNISSLQMQISNYYPPHVTDRLLKHYSLPQTKEKKAWQNIFGRIIADGQVRAPSRYLVDNLVRNGVDIKNVWRYLIAYRLSFITNEVAPASFGVSHAMDRPIWNYSITHEPTPVERDLMDAWIRDLRAFVNDEEGYVFGTELTTEYKVMQPQGTIAIERDGRWEELLQVMDILSALSSVTERRRRRRSFNQYMDWFDDGASDSLQYSQYNSAGSSTALYLYTQSPNLDPYLPTLKTSLAFASVTALSRSLAIAAPPSNYLNWKTFKANGVNLGGWLHQEAVIDPTWWKRYAPGTPDEWDFCAKLKSQSGPDLEQRYGSYITAKDINTMAAAGSQLYSGNQARYLRAMSDYAIKKHGIHVILDIHSLPGGLDGMGLGENEGNYGWFQNQTALEYSYKAVDAALKFTQESHVPQGFTLAPINEPYSQGIISRVEKVYPKIPIMLQGGFRPIDYWAKYFAASTNIVDTKGTVGTASPKFPVFVGEWSIQAATKNTFASRARNLNTGLKAWAAYTQGSAYWTWKFFGIVPVDGEGTQGNYWNYSGFVKMGVITPPSGATCK